MPWHGLTKRITSYESRLQHENSCENTKYAKKQIFKNQKFIEKIIKC